MESLILIENNDQRNSNNAMNDIECCHLITVLCYVAIRSLTRDTCCEQDLCRNCSSKQTSKTQGAISAGISIIIYTVFNLKESAFVSNINNAPFKLRRCLFSCSELLLIWLGLCDEPVPQMICVVCLFVSIRICLGSSLQLPVWIVHNLQCRESLSH